MNRIMIWGSGENGQLFFDCLDTLTCKVVAVVDNDETKWGKKAFHDSAIIISPSEIQNYSYDYLCVCTLYKDDVLKQCAEMGLSNCISGDMDAASYLENSFLLKKSALAVVIKHEVEQKTYRMTMECNWSNVFHDTVNGYDWYNVKSISLGRWAIGYPYAYVMARVLNWLHPTCILECGLGQSTKIINSYVSYYSDENCKLDVVEQDKDWIDFFCKDNKLDKNVSIHNRALRTVRINGNECYAYSNFQSIVENKKYAFISIDGPWGGDFISRVDILEYIPDILEGQFAIMMDDYERLGEKNTVDMIMKKLSDNGIKAKKGLYRGEKDMCIIVPDTMDFMFTM